MSDSSTAWSNSENSPASPWIGMLCCSVNSTYARRLSNVQRLLLCVWVLSRRPRLLKDQPLRGHHHHRLAKTDTGFYNSHGDPLHGSIANSTVYNPRSGGKQALANSSVDTMRPSVDGVILFKDMFTGSTKPVERGKISFSWVPLRLGNRRRSEI